MVFVAPEMATVRGESLAPLVVDDEAPLDPGDRGLAELPAPVGSPGEVEARWQTRTAPVFGRNSEEPHASVPHELPVLVANDHIDAGRPARPDLAYVPHLSGCEAFDRDLHALEAGRMRDDRHPPGAQPHEPERRAVDLGRAVAKPVEANRGERGAGPLPHQRPHDRRRFRRNGRLQEEGERRSGRVQRRVSGLRRRRLVALRTHRHRPALASFESQGRPAEAVRSSAAPSSPSSTLPVIGSTSALLRSGVHACPPHGETRGVLNDDLDHHGACEGEDRLALGDPLGRGPRCVEGKEPVSVQLDLTHGRRVCGQLVEPARSLLLRHSGPQAPAAEHPPQ